MEFASLGLWAKNSADVDSIQPFVEKLCKLILKDGLVLEQLYNADETGLYWRVLPKTTLASAVEKDVPRGKSQKDRVTTLGCANAMGQHKLKPVLVGRYLNPRCFKHVDMKGLPVQYTAQMNAWMSTETFEDWFQLQFIPTVMQHLQCQGLPCKAILLIDNCSAHLYEEVLCSNDGKIRAIFLPQNKTSVIKPLNGGILETIKRNYCKLPLQRVLAANERETSCSLLEIVKSHNMKDVVYMVGESWDKVKPKSIKKVWNKTLINKVNQIEPTHESIIEPDEESEEDTASTMSHELRRAGFDVSEGDTQAWLTIDQHEPGHALLTEEEIIEAVRTHKHDSTSDEESEDNVDAVLE